MAAPAHATDQAYTVTAVSIPVKVGPNGDQSCTVDADLYRPADATASHPDAAILTTNGFGGSKDDTSTAGIGTSFAKAGYVVLSYSGLGFGATTCKISLDDPDYDGRAGSQLVTYLAGLDYVATNAPGDPKVGMVGGSYGGQIQYAVASQDKRVDAIIPIITWNDLSYSLAPNNATTTRGVSYAVPGVAKREWVDLFFADGIASGVQNVTVAHDPETLVGCPNFTDAACTAVLALNATGAPNAQALALTRHASVSSYASKVTAPTLLVQGEKDTLFNLQEAVATYHQLRAAHTPVRMVWQSWGHSDGTPAPGELDLTAGLQHSYLGTRFLNWMNHYVRGDSSAPVGPQFSYFRPWVSYAGTDVAKAYATASSFSESPTARLWLSGTSALVASRSSVAPGAATYANAGPVPTSYSETSGVEGSLVNLPATDGAGSFVSFTTAPLTKDADLVGSPQATLHLSAPAVLFAKLYDVAPDGTQTLQNRLISPVRVTDVSHPVHIALPGVVQRFAAGHQLRLVVAASDAAYGGNLVPVVQTVSTSRTAPSYLDLPLTSSLSLG
ncbi:CocE/NonD family hydrolase [Nocardioides mangrovicus]|uniref:CocE/NonD family hydrolase n=2 Tax=Nocardioides mangrovicus TaxID=2478913 RepID=A0A3L8P433_9ACTN|nr:CocE/NonD family hydrolase [Nocardioides mangrovicus]